MARASNDFNNKPCYRTHAYLTQAAKGDPLPVFHVYEPAKHDPSGAGYIREYVHYGANMSGILKEPVANISEAIAALKAFEANAAKNMQRCEDLKVLGSQAQVLHYTLCPSYMRDVVQAKIASAQKTARGKYKL